MNKKRFEPAVCRVIRMAGDVVCTSTSQTETYTLSTENNNISDSDWE